MGQEEKLRPYNEPPSDDMNPWVTQETMNMGVSLDQIQHALKEKTYNNAMATYHTLKFKKAQSTALHHLD